jgi:hypothetical protein
MNSMLSRLLGIAVVVSVALVAVPQAPAAVTLFTAGVDSTYTLNPVSVPAVSNPHIPLIDPGVILTPPPPILLNGLAVGPLNGITYGPGAYNGSTGGSTGFVHVSYTATTPIADQLFFEVANVGDYAYPSGLAIDNIKINGSLIEGFESGIPGTWTTNGFSMVSAAVANLAPTEGLSFAFLDTTGSGTAMFDTVDGTSAGSLLSPTLSLLLGDTIEFDIAFLTTDGTSTYHDYGLASFNIPPVEGTVPEPASVIIWSLLGAGTWLGARVWRRGRVGVTGDVSIPTMPATRQPWSPEARNAIHEIIARGNHR